jgi:hypothetical protein
MLLSSVPKNSLALQSSNFKRKLARVARRSPRSSRIGPGKRTSVREPRRPIAAMAGREIQVAMR